MEFLEQIWEILGNLFNGLGRVVERSITSLFGSSNARYIKKLQPKIDAINALEPKYQAMSDAELKEQTATFRKRLAQGETLDDLLNEAFAVCREAGRRFLGMRHYDVQLIGGMVLHSGAIAEMITGEGKTLVATLPAYLNALEGQGVHVVTVNDYLARRDMEWMAPLYMNLGLTVGTIQSGMNNDERQKAYACDITYGTNNEFGFDYLRDNMRPAARDDYHFPKHMQQVQGPLHYAIIDEVDNILVDEARTPLIISGPAHDDVTKYSKADKIARQLTKDTHFEVKEKEHTVVLTDEGVRAAERFAGVESFYTAGNMEWPHLIDNSLKAHHLYKRDVNYVIENGEIIIVDEFTGRKMPGRQWSDGLHQSVEAKEGVRVKEETQTLATITLQNFFKLYKKICGMTGTAMTEANEFWKIYKLDVIAIPPNRTLQRVNYPDVIYLTEKDKFNQVANEIERIHKWDTVELDDGSWLVGAVKGENEQEITFDDKDNRELRTIKRSQIKNLQKRGRPILVGTVSIEKSERLSALLERRGIPHQVLNAKHHKREAEIVAQAGRKGAVTIATNMAGRGTDIVLGGNPDSMAWAQLQDRYPTRLEVPREEWDALVRQIDEREKCKIEGAEVKQLGGLHIIGTERHEARRIDNQLRGRSGRQGDPGSGRFFLSLEDDLMRIFAGEFVKSVLTRLGMKEGEAIESRMVSRRIEGAQRKVEERNFDIRKNLLEYDEVMDEQRKRVYSYRQRILEGDSCKELIQEMIDRQVEQNVNVFLDKDYGSDTFAKWASSLLSEELDPREFRNLDFETAQRLAKDQAERMAESQVFEAVEENLPEGNDEDWNWEALAKFANSRWKTNLRDRDLKKVGRDGVTELLIDAAREAIGSIDLSEGLKFLAPDHGLRTACGWVHYKFGIQINPDEVHDLEPAQLIQRISQKTRETYAAKEAEFPVLAGLLHFTTRDATGQKRYDRDQLVSWARERFQVEFSLDDLKHKQQEEVRALLVDHSRGSLQAQEQAHAEVRRLVDAIFAETAAAHGATNGAVVTVRVALGPDWRDNPSVQTLVAKLNSLDPQFPADKMALWDEEQLRRRAATTVDDHFRPEMRRLERNLVLQILDAAWKDHLLAMDHLRSSVSLRGYAQVDPKVEYKREGMRTFETMWSSIGDRVTDLIFRMEQLDEGFVGSMWKETAAVHDEAPPPTAIGQQQQSAIDSSQGEAQKLEPIRNQGQRVGRNDPLPLWQRQEIQELLHAQRERAGMKQPRKKQGVRCSKGAVSTKLWNNPKFRAIIECSRARLAAEGGVPLVQVKAKLLSSD